jgi:predicted esterase
MSSIVRFFGSKYVHLLLLAIPILIRLSGCSSDGDTGTNADNSDSLCSLNSSDPQGSGSLRYCDAQFDESEIAMTTYKYATTANPNGSGTVDLYMDVYSRSSDSVTDRPFVVWMHAGGGERDDADPASWCRNRFGKRGYVCASIDYRDSNSSGFTQNDQKLAVSDAQSAIRYLRAHASALGIDPNKAILMGSSAGALTAVQAAVTGNDQNDDYFDDPDINDENSGQPSWACASSTLSGAISSPVMNMVDSKDPPNFAYHGELDMTIAYSQAVETVNTMIDLGIPSTLMSFPDKAHSLGSADIIEADLFPQLYDWIITDGCPHSYMSQTTL